MKNTILFFTFLLIIACNSPEGKPIIDSSESNQISSTINKVLNVSDFLTTLEAKPKSYLIDVRTPEEFEEGALPNAKNINFYDDEFKMNIGKLDKKRPVMVYCKSGGRSGKTAKLLSKLGFQEIYDLDGGYNAYKTTK